jgi:hypothetical protein
MCHGVAESGCIIRLIGQGYTDIRDKWIRHRVFHTHGKQVMDKEWKAFTIFEGIEDVGRRNYFTIYNNRVIVGDQDPNLAV